LDEKLDQVVIKFAGTGIERECHVLVQGAFGIKPIMNFRWLGLCKDQLPP
jgi:hypothetical protein